MPGSYNNKRAKKLLHMVKNVLSPEEDWSSYPVELVGRAHAQHFSYFFIKNYLL